MDRSFVSGWWRSLFAGRGADLFASRTPWEVLSKGYHLWRREGSEGVLRAAHELIFGGLPYHLWVRNHDSLSREDRRLITEHIGRLSNCPRISVLMPVCNPRANWLRAAIDSVHRQLYPDWELCIADGDSTDPYAHSILQEVRKSDPRVKVSFLNEDNRTSSASNTAMEMATGEFIVLLDYDDELSDYAFYMLAVALDQNPNLSLIYSDEDKIDPGGNRYGPYFKPDWNPELQLARNLFSGFSAFRASLVRSVGGFRSEFGGAQHWDLANRVVERTQFDQIAHIPRVLCHHHDSAILDALSMPVQCAASDYPMALRVLIDCSERRGLNAEVEMTEPGIFRFVYKIPDPPPQVSVIIPTRNGLSLLQRCLDGLFSRTDYPAFEIIVVDNSSDDPQTLGYLEVLASAQRIRVLRYDAPFNYSAINNMAVEQAIGDLICLLNNDVEPIGTDWLREMVSHAVRPEVGAVGAMLYYPDDTIQHAGVFLNGFAADHFYKGYPRGTLGDANRARLVQEVSAVTAACLVVRKEIWEQVGGLDEANLTVAFNDVDFCLKVRECGYRNIWTPFAELYHHESVSRGRDDTPEKRARFDREVAYLQSRWGDVLQCDPAVNPNRSFRDPAGRLACPPRIERPWISYDAVQ